MKRIINTIFALILIAGFVACDKSDESITDNNIEGTYEGTITTSLKSANTVMPGISNATAEIMKSGEDLIEVHCFSDDIDTTFMLNYYEDHDSVMVCLNGEAFQQMYGHMMGQGHMGGGMMGNIDGDETEWMHHLNDEHQPGDEHFGGFDMMNHSFGYSFEMTDGDNHYMLHFEGTKN